MGKKCLFEPFFDSLFARLVRFFLQACAPSRTLNNLRNNLFLLQKWQRKTTVEIWQSSLSWEHFSLFHICLTKSTLLCPFNLDFLCVFLMCVCVHLRDPAELALNQVQYRLHTVKHKYFFDLEHLLTRDC